MSERSFMLFILQCSAVERSDECPPRQWLGPLVIGWKLVYSNHCLGERLHHV